MDQAKVISLVAKKHAIRLNQDDPIWVIGTLAEDLNKEALTQLQKVMAEHLDQISAAHVQAENAAKAKGEVLLTQGTEWATKKIREAGEAATARFIAETQKELADAKKQLGRAIIAAWLAAATAACAAIGAVAVLWL